MKKMFVLFVILMMSTKAFCQIPGKELAPYRIPVYKNADEYKKYIGKYIAYFPFVNKDEKNAKLAKKLGNSYREIKVEDISVKELPIDRAIRTEWTFDTSGPDLELTVYFGDTLQWNPKLKDLTSKKEFCFYEFPFYNLQTRTVYKLSKVEKPDNPEIRFGDIKIVTDSLTKYSFEDNTIDITLYVLSDEINFNLKNKSPHSLKILWDEGVFVDENGSTSGIAHGGIKYIDVEKKQIPTTIIHGASLDDIVVPIRNVYRDEYTHRWCVHSLVPNIEWNETRQIKLMLPIQIKGVTNEYVFTFDVYKEKSKVVD